MQHATSSTAKKIPRFFMFRDSIFEELNSTNVLTKTSDGREERDCAELRLFVNRLQPLVDHYLSLISA